MNRLILVSLVIFCVDSAKSFGSECDNSTPLAVSESSEFSPMIGKAIPPGPCEWRGPNGGHFGNKITFIPPDYPTSNGYYCWGNCPLLPGDPFPRPQHCDQMGIVDEGGGVFSQECRCNP